MYGKFTWKLYAAAIHQHDELVFTRGILGQGKFVDGYFKIESVDAVLPGEVFRLINFICLRCYR